MLDWVLQFLPKVNIDFVLFVLNLVTLTRLAIKTNPNIVCQIHTIGDLFALITLDLIEQVKTKNRLNGC